MHVLFWNNNLLVWGDDVKLLWGEKIRIIKRNIETMLEATKEISAIIVIHNNPSTHKKSLFTIFFPRCSRFLEHSVEFPQFLDQDSR